MRIESEHQAIEAVEAVLTWAETQPETHHGGSTTGLTYQRGRIVATRVMPDRTVGVSTYETIHDARVKAAAMERGYREWLRLQRPHAPR